MNSSFSHNYENQENVDNDTLLYEFLVNGHMPTKKVSTGMKIVKKQKPTNVSFDKLPEPQEQNKCVGYQPRSKIEASKILEKCNSVWVIEPIEELQKNADVENETMIEKPLSHEFLNGISDYCPGIINLNKKDRILDITNIGKPNEDIGERKSVSKVDSLLQEWDMCNNNICLSIDSSFFDPSNHDNVLDMFKIIDPAVEVNVGNDIQEERSETNIGNKCDNVSFSPNPTRNVDISSCKFDPFVKLTRSPETEMIAQSITKNINDILNTSHPHLECDNDDIWPIMNKGNVIFESQNEVKAFHDSQMVQYSHTLNSGKEVCNKKCISKIKGFRNLLNNRKKGKKRPTKVFPCNICNGPFFKFGSLKNHLISHRTKTPYKCHICRNRFIKEATLKSHKIVHHCVVQKKFCKICKESFKYRYAYSRHLLVHQRKTPYLCNVCNKRFSIHKLYKEHTKSHNVKEFKCKVCDKVYTYAKSFRSHQKVHQKKRSNKCALCTNIRIFKHPNNLKRHMQTHRNSGLECKLCAKVLPTAKRFKSHMIKHAKQQHSYVCGICGKKFKRVSNLVRHEAAHSVEVNYECEVCKKVFTIHSKYKAHIVTHRHPHQCSFCDETFKSGVDLKIHVVQHAKQNPHVCSICNKTFPADVILEAHMLTHNGQPKDEKCPFCDRTFRQLAALKQHVVTHAKRRGGHCEICGLRFVRPGDLQKHRLSHTRGDDLCYVRVGAEKKEA